MARHIFFIEGLPGSGKSTFARRLADRLKGLGHTVKVFNEGVLHPISLAWTAILDGEKYEEVLSKYPKYEDAIRKQSIIRGNQYHLAYTKVPVDKADYGFYREIGALEVRHWDDVESVLEVYDTLYHAFARESDTDTVYIFESIFLQNHINPLLLKHGMGKDEATRYFKRLIEPIASEEMTFLFVRQADVESILKRITEERVSPSPDHPDWIDQALSYLKDQPYSKTLGYEGYPGLVQYFKDRQSLERRILDTLQAQTLEYTLNESYDAVFRAMSEDALRILTERR